MQADIGDLLDRAERANAAITVFDEQNRVVGWNQALAQLYTFIDFGQPQTYENIVQELVSRQLMNVALGDRDPKDWLAQAVQFHRVTDFAQFVRRLSDGRILLLTHEKIAGTPNWWYQTRIDITAEMMERIRYGQVLLGADNWGRRFAPIAGPSGALIEDVLEAMPTAAAVIKGRGQLLDANRAFHALLRRGDGLLEVDGRVMARKVSEQTILNERITKFIQDPSNPSSVVMRISRADRDEPYFVCISQLVKGSRPVWSEDTRIAVMTVADPRHEPTIDPQMLAEFFQITLAEAQIAADLGTGRSVQEIASQRGVTVNTVYSQVKSILGKTGFKGQADIARRVVGLSWVFGQKCGQ
jgi:DNA-binding CsgD family transcriptional regulator/PAS domain-containing protein